MRELTEGQLQKTAQQIADQAMPAAKGVTDGAIRPAAQTVAEKVRVSSHLMSDADCAGQTLSMESALWGQGVVCLGFEAIGDAQLQTRLRACLKLYTAPCGL